MGQLPNASPAAVGGAPAPPTGVATAPPAAVGAAPPAIGNADAGLVVLPGVPDAAVVVPAGPTGARAPPLPPAAVLAGAAEHVHAPGLPSGPHSATGLVPAAQVAVHATGCPGLHACVAPPVTPALLPQPASRYAKPAAAKNRPLLARVAAMFLQERSSVVARCHVRAFVTMRRPLRQDD